MASVRLLKFEKFRFFCQISMLGMDNCDYQISSKSTNSRLRYGDKAICKMAAVRHHEFAKIAILVMWRISACDSSYTTQISRWSANKTSRYNQSDIQYGVRPPCWIWKKSIFVKFPCPEWKSASMYQIWPKSDNSRLKYGDKAIFKMAAVRHLQFSKNAVLVTWPALTCDSEFPFQISH